MAANFDDINVRLLNTLQVGVPLVARPWGALAEAVGVDEADVLRRIRQLKGEAGGRGIIRQISAIFDSKSLGYQSTLVAARVEEAHLPHAVAAINAHPGVSHNYQRNHEYNVWFTLAVPPDSSLGLEKTLHILQRQSGASTMRMFPTLRLYKIGVRLGVGGDPDGTPAQDSPQGYSEASRQKITPLTEQDKKLIRVLQQDLPVVETPFDAWAQEAGVSLPELFRQAEHWRETGVMRRFSAVLRHREVGFQANAMGVWAVPLEKVEAFGEAAARFAAVSHCYQRPTYADWPYNLFTMVHGNSPADCEAVLGSIAQATGVETYRALYSSVEFKKVRVKYFMGDVEAWEREQG